MVKEETMRKQAKVKGDQFESKQALKEAKEEAEHKQAMRVAEEEAKEEAELEERFWDLLDRDHKIKYFMNKVNVMITSQG
eukprot:m51a1_g595 hypothetical protein (80) ;mRNA; f:57381-57620